MPTTRRRWMLTALAVVCLALVLGGVWLRVEAVGSSSQDWKKSIRELRTRERAVLPAELPPSFEDAWIEKQRRGAKVTFYSVNEAFVSVCTGACDHPIPAKAVLRSLEASGDRVTVFIDNRTLDPKWVAPELARFWAEVPLSTSAPGWLESS